MKGVRSSHFERPRTYFVTLISNIYVTLDINQHTELPFEIKLSFKSLVEEYKTLVDSESDFVSQNALRILRIAEEHPVLVEGFDHIELLENYKDQIDHKLRL